jgi:hypothetical protein
MVDGSLRPTITGTDVPLILAATEPLASIFRSVCALPQLLPETLTSTNDRSTDAEIAAAAQPILDADFARKVAEAKSLFEQRAGSGRATTDLSDAARAATFGAVEVLMVDMDGFTPGNIDDSTGKVTLAGTRGPETYGVVDEIMARALAGGATIFSLRAQDMPEGASVAAVLRYPV